MLKAASFHSGLPFFPFIRRSGVSFVQLGLHRTTAAGYYSPLDAVD